MHTTYIHTYIHTFISYWQRRSSTNLSPAPHPHPHPTLPPHKIVENKQMHTCIHTYSSTAEEKHHQHAEQSKGVVVEGSFYLQWRTCQLYGTWQNQQLQMKHRPPSSRSAIPLIPTTSTNLPSTYVQPTIHHRRFLRTLPPSYLENWP